MMANNTRWRDWSESFGIYWHVSSCQVAWVCPQPLHTLPQLLGGSSPQTNTMAPSHPTPWLFSGADFGQQSADRDLPGAFGQVGLGAFVARRELRRTRSVCDGLWQLIHQLINHNRLNRQWDIHITSPRICLSIFHGKSKPICG